MLLNGIRTSTSYPRSVTRPFDWNTKSAERSGASRAEPELFMKPPPPVLPVSTSVPSLCTPNGFTAKTSACRVSSNVPRRSCT